MLGYLDVKDTVVQSHVLYTGADGVTRLRIRARPNVWHRDDCPWCGRRGLPRYDRQAAGDKVRRGLDFAGVVVEIECATHRVTYPEHGVVTAAVPWAYSRSGFTRQFDITVAWLAEYLPRSAVVPVHADRLADGRRVCVPGVARPGAGTRPASGRAVNIGIDETSYRKGYKFVTVVVNHDTNTVVWVGDGHGKLVLERFYRSLSAEQLASIRTVTGDGARWITDCADEFTPGCERCVNPFYVVEWTMDALDEVRSERWRVAREQAGRIAEGVRLNRGRPRAGDGKAVAVREAGGQEGRRWHQGLRLRAGQGPGEPDRRPAHPARHDPVGRPETVSAVPVEGIPSAPAGNDRRRPGRDGPETLAVVVEPQQDPAASRELYAKIKRHKGHIPGTIRLGTGNTSFEATNNKIRLIIRKAYGFRNFGNVMDMMYLVCPRHPHPSRTGNQPHENPYDHRRKQQS